MLKRLLSTVLVVCIVFALIPPSTVSAATPAYGTDEYVAAKIDELYHALNGKYFNTNQGDACGVKTSGHGCSKCTIGAVVKTQWFKNMFGNVSTSQFFSSGSASCMGFVQFAEWYIYKANQSDSVRRWYNSNDDVGRIAFNYNNISEYAHVGDYLRLTKSASGNSGHSAIYIGCNSSGIEVLDCNYSGKYNCMVQKHAIPYNGSFKYFIVGKMSSETYGKGNAEDDFRTTRELTIKAENYPSGTLKQGASFPLSGTVKSSFMITYFSGAIIRNDGTIVSSASQTASTKSLSIRRSKVDMNLKFSQLTDGVYHLEYTVKDSSGKTVTWKSPEFTVGTPKKATCTITFNANGGSVSTSSRTVDVGSSYGTLPTPTRDGYEFEGWYSSREGGWEASSGTTAQSSDAITLYAHWREITSDISFNVDGYPQGEFTEGTSYSLRGQITSNLNLKEVYAEICDLAGVVYSSYTDYPDSKTYSITNSRLSSNLHFENLPAGAYILFINATDSSGLLADWGCDEFYVNEAYEQEKPHTHVKGSVAETEYDHPHYIYYYCSICGERFTDGSKGYNDSCTTCNPPAKKTTKSVTNWSSWSTTPAYSSATREVETRTVKVSDGYYEYRYGRYITPGAAHDCWCDVYLKKLYPGTVTLQYSNWSKTRYSEGSKGWSCGVCSGNHMGVDHYTSDGRAWWAEYNLPDGKYYWEDMRWVDAKYETQYRYRDIIYV